MSHQQTAATSRPSRLISHQDLQLEMGMDGGRILSFRRGDREWLLTSAVHPDNFGATFWPSPQALWGWPPPADIDGNAYQDHSNDEQLSFLSPECKDTQLQLRKIVTPFKHGFELRFELKNLAEAQQSVACWIISRVRGAQTFWSEGEHWSEEACPFPQLPSESKDGVACFDHAQWQSEGDGKSFIWSAEGWLAHLDQGEVFYQIFQRLEKDQQAPGEGMIEIYAIADRRYIELEAQGPLCVMNSQDTQSWSIFWFSERAPEGGELAIAKRARELEKLIAG